MAEEIDLVAVYLDALQKLDDANKCVVELIQVIQDGAAALKNWQSISVEPNGQISHNPVGPQRLCVPITNISKWPDVKSINAALKARRDALHAAQLAYQQVRTEHHIGLVHPDSLPLPSP